MKELNLSKLVESYKGKNCDMEFKINISEDMININHEYGNVVAYIHNDIQGLTDMIDEVLSRMMRRTDTTIYTDTVWAVENNLPLNSLLNNPNAADQWKRISHLCYYDKATYTSPRNAKLWNEVHNTAYKMVYNHLDNTKYFDSCQTSFLVVMVELYLAKYISNIAYKSDRRFMERLTYEYSYSPVKPAWEQLLRECLLCLVEDFNNGLFDSLVSNNQNI